MKTKQQLKQAISVHNGRRSPNTITHLQPNQVFVFGSNTAGFHGKGAAKDALQWGAQYSNPSGRQGQTYAIVTKNLHQGERSVGLAEIEAQIETFLDYARSHSDTEFLVTTIGCGLGGYRPGEIAQLWRNKTIPRNVRLPSAFLRVLQQPTTNQTQLNTRFAQHQQLTNSQIDPSLEPPTMKTTQTETGLKVPKFDASYNRGKGRRLESVELKGTLLESLFEPEELESLLLVKIKKDAPDSHLRGRVFKDGIRRELAFSSGENYYFADDTLRKKIKGLFKAEPDAACRYGPLLTSSCLNGKTTETNLRVKIVDDSDPEDRKRWEVNDCHGKVSPRIAVKMGGEPDRAVQFRFGYRSDGSNDNPLPDYAAKGTFLPDKTLTDDCGYDVILPLSSIKPSALKKYIECGDYVLPKASILNRENSSIGFSKVPWQAVMELTPEDIIADFGPATERKAQQLAWIQSLHQTNPLALKQYVIEQHDRKQSEKKGKNQTESDNTDSDLNEDQPEEGKQTHRMIEKLRHDRYGLLLNEPKVVDFLQEQFAGEFRKLAINSGYNFTAGLVLPCEGLKPGEISAKHLPLNESIVFTRNPVLNQDGVCLVMNVANPNPKLTQYKGIIWVSPEEYELHRSRTTDFEQLGGDYDGDKGNTAPARDLKHTAKRLRYITEPGNHVVTDKLPKLAYTDPTCVDGNGNPYEKLRQIAIESGKHRTGQLCAAIGRVQTAVPNPDEDPHEFERQQKKLLVRLYIAAKAEVDYGKSALRFSDLKKVKVHACPELPHLSQSGRPIVINVDGKNLLEDVKAFTDEHPSPFFDVYKDPRLYRTIALPTDHNGPLETLAKHFVNPVWEPTRLRALEKHEFLNVVPEPIVPEPKNPNDDKAWEKYETAKDIWEQYLDWAKDLRDRVDEARRDLAELCTDGDQFDKERFGKEISALYQSIQQEIDQELTNPNDRRWAFAANWRVQHMRTSDKDQKHCLDIARSLNTTFTLESDYQLPTEITAQDRYVLSVPFGKKVEDWKAQLDDNNVRYMAVVNPDLPMIDFVMLDLSTKNRRQLEQRYGDRVNALSDIDLPDGLNNIYDLRIVPPSNYTWAHRLDSPGKASLAFALFHEELVEHLQSFEVEHIQVWGIPHNDFKDVDFRDRAWRSSNHSFEIQAFDAAERFGIVHPKYDEFQGRPVITLDDQYLGTFSPLTCKLPIGTKFEARVYLNGTAVDLKIDPDSIELPEVPKFSINQHRTESKQQRWEAFLISNIKQAYLDLAAEGKAERIEEFPVGDDLIARVCATGDLVIIDEAENKYFQSNFKTGRTPQHLDKTTLDRLDRMLDQQLQQEKQANRHRSSRQPVQLS